MKYIREKKHRLHKDAYSGYNIVSYTACVKYRRELFIACMDKFKQKTGYWLTRNMSSHKWQKDYFDHILRKQESLENKVKYILMNPVRKGIVEYWKDYKFKGSTVYNLEEWKCKHSQP